MPPISGIHVEVLTVLKWFIVALVSMVFFKIVSTWAGEFATRILYRGILKGDDTQKTNKPREVGNWLSGVLESQEKFTRSVIELTKELQEIKNIAKNFKCNYSQQGEHHDEKIRST